MSSNMQSASSANTAHSIPTTEKGSRRRYMYAMTAPRNVPTTRIMLGRMDSSYEGICSTVITDVQESMAPIHREAEWIDPEAYMPVR